MVYVVSYLITEDLYKRLKMALLSHPTEGVIERKHALAALKLLAEPVEGVPID